MYMYSATIKSFGQKKMFINWAKAQGTRRFNEGSLSTSKMRSFTGITPHNDEGGERSFERHEPHTTPGSFQGEATIAWLVSLQSCQALDRPKVWMVHKQNF